MIAIECSCGQPMNFADQLYGVTAVCPSCGLQSTIEPMSTAIRIVREDFGPDVPRAKVNQHWWQSTPIMCFAGISIGTIGLGLIYAPERPSKLAASPSVGMDVPDRVAAQQPSPVYAGNPSHDKVMQWKPYARYRAEIVPYHLLANSDMIERYEVVEIDANPALADPRKLSWLWDVSAKVKVRFKPGHGSTDPNHVLHIDALMRLMPPCEELTVYWHAMTDEETRVSSRKHFANESEWSADFRKSVKEAKVDAKKKRRGPEKDHMIAGWFNISEAELGEILKSPD